MSNQSNISEETSMNDFPNSVLSYSIRIWLNLVVLIPSILCVLFVLYCFLFNKTLRTALNNHIIIILLLVSFICKITIYPWMIQYYRFKTVLITQPIFCQIWTFIDYTSNCIQNLLFAWATIERHILIFHDRWLLTKKKRFFIHYLPIIGIISYCSIYYFLIIFVSFCENSYDYTRIRCVNLCSYNSDALILWDTIVNQFLPIMVINCFSIGLFVRVIRQKRRLNQTIQWRKYRKLTIQLISISILFLFLKFPWAFLNILFLCGIYNDNIFVVSVYASFVGYYFDLLFPFVCAASLPELRLKMKNIFLFKRHHQLIVPVQEIALKEIAQKRKTDQRQR